MSRNAAFQIGLILGVVWIIMGFAYSNPAIWILGLILLSVGLVSKITRKK
jgi:hypothetical protein